MAIEPVYDPRATSVPVLRYLVAVADHLHFGNAARACSVSQPTLSALIAQWEKRMRVRVFERSPTGVRVTPAGARVVAAARTALAALRDVEEAAQAGKPPFFGPVRLGAIPTVAPYALPFVAPAVEAAFPDLELPLREGTTDELLSLLDDDRIDAALLALLPGMAGRFAAEELYEEPFLVALPRGHRLAKSSTIAGDDLADERLLLLDEGHCLRDQALDVCGQRREGRPGADWRATSLETLRQLVAAGLGVTVLPALAAPDDDGASLRCRPLRGGRASRTIALIWRAADPRDAAYRQLAGVIRRAVPRERLAAAR